MKAKIRKYIVMVSGVILVSIGLVSFSSAVRAACYEERSCALFSTSDCETRCAPSQLLCTWKYVGISEQPVIYPVSSGYESTVPTDDPPIIGVCYDQIACNITVTECTWPTGDPDDEFFCEEGSWIGDYETVTFVDYLDECD